MVAVTQGVHVEDPSFRLFWWGTALSTFGVAFSAGAVSVLAIQELGVPDSYVPLMLGVASIVAALGALPLGPWVEKSRKRPILVGAAWFRGLLLLCIAALAWTDLLTFPFLVAVLVFVSLSGIASGSASGVHLRDLLREEDWPRANGKIESLVWIMSAVATPIGGVVIVAANPGVVLAVNGLAYVCSGLLIWRIPQPEPQPVPAEGTGWQGQLKAITAGWRIIFQHRALRGLFLNAMLFGGCLTVLNPLLAVFMLRDLGLDARALTIVLGVPAAAGFIGARLSGWVSARVGPGTLLLWAGAARSIWAPFLALSPKGIAGFVVILCCECGLMFAAGLFNPVFATYRMRLVDRGVLARVGAAWPISASLVQPMFLFCGALIVAWFGTRVAIGVIGLCMLACIPLIPWRAVRAEGAKDTPAKLSKR